MSKNLIIVFTRNPELGKVKTRLAKTVGDKSALNIYKYLLLHTKNVLSKVTNADKGVYYSVKIRENDIWEATLFQKYQQEGEDLGIRMHNAFKNGFKEEYSKIIIVGSDLYDLNENHINKAFKSLDKNDIVIGPAIDGGYYLLGMKTLHPQVFNNKDWGTETVRKDTLKDLKNNTVFLLDELNDIDLYEDVKNYDSLMKLI